MVNWNEIDRLAKAHRLVDPSSTEETLLRQLRVWYCTTYNRPFKDPLLFTYTIEELAYEYLCHYYLEPEHDPILQIAHELQKTSDDDWILQQLREHQQKQAALPEPAPKEPEKIEEPVPAAFANLPEISTSFDAE